MVHTKKKILIVISIIIGIAISLFISELVLRLLGKGYGSAPLESDSVFHHVHPSSYSYTVHTPSNEYGGYEVYYDKDRLVSNPEHLYNNNSKL